MPHEIKDKSQLQITLGFSVHRPEMVPLTFALMQRHDALFLEEPPSADFNDMLQGAVSIDDYLMPLDVEYPEFSRRMCRRLRKLHTEGKVIVQVEPFLEVLLGIHDFFAEGHAPEDLPKDSLQYPVYLAERKATGALLTYYQAAVSGSFEETIAAIIKFARLDAARFRLRDSLRVQELVPLIEKYPSAYIEAGAIHYQLGQLLRQKLPKQTRVRPVFLADFALKKLDKLSIAALTQRMGNVSALPEELTDKILGAYHQFIEAYLNVLRQKENKPMDWFPRTLSIDPELADGMRHFYSDYQHITRKFFKLNQKLDRLREDHNDNRSKRFQDRIDEIFKLCAE
jgi:hypothetical protein